MKRLTLNQIVAQAVDMFYREYATDTAFWDEDNFKVNVISYYAKLVNDEYADKKSQNKNETGFSIVELSSSWLKEEVLTVKNGDKGGYIETEDPIFEFTFDALSSAVHSILPVEKCDFGEILRVSNKDIWKIDRLPPSNNIYWYGLLGKLRLVSKIKLPEKFKVIFLPAMTMESDCALVPEPYVTVIITTILNQMFGAKKEMVVIDETNDGNPNDIEQTELNPDNLKN